MFGLGIIEHSKHLIRFFKPPKNLEKSLMQDSYKPLLAKNMQHQHTVICFVRVTSYWALLWAHSHTHWRKRGHVNQPHAAPLFPSSCYFCQRRRCYSYCGQEERERRKPSPALAVVIRE